MEEVIVQHVSDVGEMDCRNVSKKAKLVASKAEEPHMSPSPTLQVPSSSEKCTTSYYDIIDCPIYYPSLEEFGNPLKYIASIRHEAEKFGICVIRPPDMWKPKQVLDRYNFLFSTRLERTHQLFKRQNEATIFIETLKVHLQKEGIFLDPWPMIGEKEVDLHLLYSVVKEFGGLQTISDNECWNGVARQVEVPLLGFHAGKKLCAVYIKYLLSFSMLSDAERKEMTNSVRLARSHPTHADDPFGFGQGATHNMDSFERLDKEWTKIVFEDSNPSSADIEKKYWDIVQGNKHFNVFYGSDLDTSVYGSGFPTDPDDIYSRFGFNLNVLPGVPESMLKYMKAISGISMPWLYMGMLFSSFCWHVEDNFLYSINYMHFGVGKRWYGVPSSDAHKLEAVYHKYLPQEFKRNPLLLHDIVTQLPPDILVKEGVKVTTCVQRPRDYVVTFPQSYHAGYSEGFNCCEAVNFAAADWLPFGVRASMSYRLEKRPVTLDQEKMLCEVARNETNEDVLRYSYPLFKQLVQREKRLRQRIAAKLRLGTRKLEVVMEQSPELFKLVKEETSDDEGGEADVFTMSDSEGEKVKRRSRRLQQKCVLEENIKKRTSRMFSLSSITSTSNTIARSGGMASTNEVLITCASCCRICHFSAAVFKENMHIKAHRRGDLNRYDVEEDENANRLCCLDCCDAMDAAVCDNIEFVVVRESEVELETLLDHLASKVSHLPPIPPQELYGII
eukprot:m.29172 g.29172  ORF g.29172 m.29172 type:complete len:729 (+) comp6125_c0_seq1:838-3024(+)